MTAPHPLARLAAAQDALLSAEIDAYLHARDALDAAADWLVSAPWLGADDVHRAARAFLASQGEPHEPCSCAACATERTA